MMVYYSLSSCLPTSSSYYFSTLTPLPSFSSNLLAPCCSLSYPTSLDSTVRHCRYIFVSLLLHLWGFPLFFSYFPIIILPLAQSNPNSRIGVCVRENDLCSWWHVYVHSLKYHVDFLNCPETLFPSHQSFYSHITVLYFTLYFPHILQFLFPFIYFTKKTEPLEWIFSASYLYIYSSFYIHVRLCLISSPSLEVSLPWSTVTSLF